MDVRESLKRSTKAALVASCSALLGRARTAQLAHILLDGARLDVHNRIDANGERMVHATVLRHATLSPVVVLDVGAHFGNWTRALLEEASSVGRSDVVVHAFEPAGRAFEELARYAASAPAPVRAVRKALSDVEGEATFYVQGDGAGTNSLVENYRRPEGAREETVPTQTVESYCRKHDIDEIALLKTDAEGHDLAVLRGARSLFERGAVAVAQFEYNFRWINARCFLRDAFQLLEPLGYRVGKVTPRGIEFYRGWHPELESFREGNYVACRPAWVGHFRSIPWWNERLGLYAG